MPSFIHRLNGIKELKSFLEMEETATHGRFRVRINPEAGPFPGKDGDKTGPTIPDIYAEAIKVSQKGHDEDYYLITNLTGHEYESYLIAESFIVQGPEKSTLPANATTDPFGALDISKKFSRAVEHQQVRALMDKEENLAGSVGVYQVEISPDMILPGMNPTPSGIMEARMVLKGNSPVFIIPNEMDNYVRPDMVSSEYLAKDPVLLRTETPMADRIAKEEAQKVISVTEKNARIELHNEKMLTVAKNTRLREIERINYLNNSIGKVIDVPEKIESLEDKKYDFNINFAVGLAIKILSFEKSFGHLPEIAPDNSLDTKELLTDIKNQITLEEFKAKNGFYLKTQVKKDDLFIEVYSKDDILVANALIEIYKSQESVRFADENESGDSYDFEEKIAIYRLNSAESDKIFEAGVNIEPQSGELESLWSYMDESTFAETWDDLPSLDNASYENEDVYDINEINAEFFMNGMDNKTLISVEMSVDKFNQSILKKQKNIDFDDEMDMAV